MFSQIKIYATLAVVAAFGVLYWMYDSAVSDVELITTRYNEAVARTERDSIKMKEIAEVSEQNQKLYIEAANQVDLRLQEIKALESDIIKHEEAKNELVKIFSDHDFTKLVKAKPGLIQRRMRTGTKRMFDQLETASTGTSDSLQRPDD